jgi:choline dehydrogenase
MTIVPTHPTQVAESHVPFSAETLELDARVQANQRRLTAELQPSYDFIVCGSGSSGSVAS